VHIIIIIIIRPCRSCSAVAYNDQSFLSVGAYVGLSSALWKNSE